MLPGTSALLNKVLWEVLRDPLQEVPAWLVRERTVMLPKDPGTTKPDRQRPITSLNVGYKLMTGTLARLLEEYATEHDVMPPKLWKGARWCHDALSIDEAVADQAKSNHHNLSVAWNDSHDLVPHQWLRKILRTIRAPRMVRMSLKWVMPLWETNVYLLQLKTVSTKLWGRRIVEYIVFSY